MKKITLLSIALLASIASFAQKWSLDKAHANVNFTVVHMALSDVDGSFKKFNASITSSKDDFSDAVFEFSADVSSINTDNEMRDGHLKGADFFDAAQFTTITFKSTSVKVSGKKLTIEGDLTMKGVTKKVTFEGSYNGPVEDQRSKKAKIGLKLTSTIKRTDFGVGKVPAVVVSEEIQLKATGEFVKE